MEALMQLSDSKCSALLALITAQVGGEEAYDTYAEAAQSVERVFRPKGRKRPGHSPVEFHPLPVFQGGYSRVRLKMRKTSLPDEPVKRLPVLRALNPQVLGIVAPTAPTSPPQASNSSLYIRRASRCEGFSS